MKTILQILLFIITGVLTITMVNAQQKSRIVIVAFGNSTTAPRKNVDSVYAVRLGWILTQKGIPNRVINSGIPGSTTGSIKDNNLFKIAHGMDRFDTAVLRYHPDWVIIDFGINDSWQDAGKKGHSRISIGEYRHNLSFFIDHIRKINGRVILLTPNPLGNKYKGYHTRRLKEYMRVVCKLARRKKVPLINTWKLYAHYVHKRGEGIDALLLDGEHPNDEGHKIIAHAVAGIIIPYVLSRREQQPK